MRAAGDHGGPRASPAPGAARSRPAHWPRGLATWHSPSASIAGSTAPTWSTGRSASAREWRGRADGSRPRIGVGYAQAWAERPLRFVIPGDPRLSRA